MGKRKKDTRGCLKIATSLHWPRKHQVAELELGELAIYVRCAEKHVLPLIKEIDLDAGGAQVLLALYTRALITDSAPFDLESAMTMANIVLALWQNGYYTPGSEYPYTLAETLLCIREGLEAIAGNVQQFQPFASKQGTSGSRSSRGNR